MLFSQLCIEYEDMVIVEDDWVWLCYKGYLRFGVVLDEILFFNVWFDDENYEGIMVDVVMLVGQLFGMCIKVVSFDIYVDVVVVFVVGKIDLFGSYYSLVGDFFLVFS